MTLSLTQIGRIVIAILLLLAAGLFVASNDRLSAGAASLLGGGGVNRVDDARRTMVYRLDSERGTVFTFTGERQQVRLLSSVGIAANAATDTEGWIYGFRISFLSGTGDVLGEYDIYSQAMLPEMMEEGGPLRFLRTSDERISTPDETFIEAPEGTARTSIIALDTDEGVTGIDVRVYERQPLTDAGAMVAFLRRSPGEQRRLTSGSAFPPDTLGENEMRTVARKSWRPIGPGGIAGEAYDLVVIYEVDPEDDEPQEEVEAEAPVAP
ncbi:hypothetical protein [Qipengyuania aquimaris]|uniref:hypothetical protein n=1 Tax=Qipengyuania aquimaris TaxID=255984 RepID=UPI001FD237D5|nr:hypothetical protein [Qipengyuania aquimaris]UOR16560.1 hypothetical protein LCM05_05805 [Qipengyuania aquimaris]